jgi:hypothetical protein
MTSSPCDSSHDWRVAIFFATIVSHAVQLNNERSLGAMEIGDVVSNEVRATEFESLQLTSA